MADFSKQVWRALCCLHDDNIALLAAIESGIGGGAGSYNSADQILLEEGGTESYSFAIGEAHSFSFSVITGSVTLQFNSGTTMTYEEGEGGGAEYSTYNDQTINFVLVSGSTKIIYQY